MYKINLEKNICFDPVRFGEGRKAGPGAGRDTRVMSEREILRLDVNTVGCMPRGWVLISTSK